MDFPECGRLDFDVAKLTIGFEGTDVVSGSIPFSLGDASDLLRQSQGSGFLKTTSFKPDDEFLTLCAERPSSRIKKREITFPSNITADALAHQSCRRPRRRVVHDLSEPASVSGEVDRKRSVNLLDVANQNGIALQVGDYGLLKKRLIISSRLISIDKWKTKLLENRANVRVLELDGRRVSPGEQAQEAIAMIRLAVGDASEFLLKHIQVVSNGRLDFFDSPVSTAG